MQFERSRRVNSAFVWPAFAVIGVIMLAVTAFWGLSTRTFINTAATAPGVVIDLEFRRSSGSSTSSSSSNGSYYPVVRFEDARENTWTFTSSSGSNPAAFSVNEPVTVLYDRENPSDARIKAFFSLWGGPLIVGGIGTVFTLVGGVPLMAILFVLGKRRRAT